MSAILIGVVLFATTNVDDLFVLLAFLCAPRLGLRNVIVGQYLGIAVLFAASALCAVASLTLPSKYVGLLGIAPIVIGIGKFRRRVREPEAAGFAGPARLSGASVLTVATVTVANGGDNIAVYVPVFALHRAGDIAVFAIVFAVMTALWVLSAHFLTSHPQLGPPIRTVGSVIAPLVLIALGVSIIVEAGTWRMILNFNK